jgi:hypothetical protein
LSDFLIYGQPPQIIQLPDKQGIVTSPGEVIFRSHNSGRYLFPLGAESVQLHRAGFSCPNCGTQVLWLLTEKGSTVFSCHCLIAVCGSELRDPALVNIGVWIKWITEAWSSKQEQLRARSSTRTM